MLLSMQSHEKLMNLDPGCHLSTGGCEYLRKGKTQKTRVMKTSEFFDYHVRVKEDLSFNLKYFSNILSFCKRKRSKSEFIGYVLEA